MRKSKTLNDPVQHLGSDRKRYQDPIAGEGYAKIFIEPQESA